LQPKRLFGFPQRLWCFALAVLAGNLALHQLPGLPGHTATVWLAAGAVLALKWRALRLPAAALLAFTWTAHAALTALEARWPEAADGEDVMLTGWIDAFPTVDPERTVLSLRVESAATDVPIRRLRLSWYEAPEGLVPGAALAIEARLRSPRGLVNRAAFDYERWLFIEGYDATGYVRAGRIESERRIGLAQGWLTLRARLAERIAQRVDARDAALLITALSLGERAGFEDRHWNVLQRTGTSHLVAVSGLHIGLIAAMFFWLLFRIALRLPYAVARQAHAVAAGLSFVPAAAYAALAGFTLPTQRALAMLLVAQCLIAARRRWPVASGLSLAGVAVLALDPLASLTASFWLSFGAVALIFAAARGAGAARGDDRVRAAGRAGIDRGARAWAWLRAFGRLQWALTLGLAPLVLWFFGQVSLASFAVNLLAIPLFSLAVVPLSLATASLAAFDGGGLGGVIVGLARVSAELAWRLLELGAAPDLAAIHLPRPGLLALLLSLAAIAMLLPRHPMPGRRLAALALLPLVLGGTEAPAPGSARVTVIDVGQGLAVAIETERHRLLYDAGPVHRSGFDAGAEIVAPVLEALGRGPLDLLILSHGDSDHAGGAAAIRARYPEARVLAGPDVTADAETCRAGQAWRWDGIRFELLHPPEGFLPRGNETSCVLRLETAGATLLITGDVEARAEARLVAQGGLAADVVIVPHHGSATSSTRAFVAAVAPRAAVVSAGHNNRFGHPRPEVRERWERSGAGVLVTSDLGAITIELDEDGFGITAERLGRRRYWQPTVRLVPGALAWTAL
jgi:competence protein ComEC